MSVESPDEGHHREEYPKRDGYDYVSSADAIAKRAEQRRMESLDPDQRKNEIVIQRVNELWAWYTGSQIVSGPLVSGNNKNGYTVRMPEGTASSTTTCNDDGSFTTQYTFSFY